MIALDRFAEIDTHIVLGVFGIWIVFRDDPALVSSQESIPIRKVSVSSNVASENGFGIFSFGIPNDASGRLSCSSSPKSWTGALRASAAAATYQHKQWRHNERQQWEKKQHHGLELTKESLFAQKCRASTVWQAQRNELSLPNASRPELPLSACSLKFIRVGSRLCRP